MLAFNLLRVDFAHGVGGSGKMTLIDASRVRVEVHQAKRLQQLLQLDKDCIRSTAKRIRKDYATQMVNRMPQPALLRFAMYETPHLIHLRSLYATDLYGHRVRPAPFHDGRIDLGELAGLFLVPQLRSWG